MFSMGSTTTASTLTVQTLGRFAVLRADAMLPETAWGRSSARRLLQYFITNRRGFTNRDRILVDLWPNLDRRRAERNFKVALHALNDALEPDRQARTPAAYIAREGITYGLDPAAPVHIDAAAFEADLLAASRSLSADSAAAVQHYRLALSRYRGEYLPDALYDDWSSGERERLATLFLNGATELARLLLAQDETVETIHWCQQIVARDPCWEEAYRLLMRSYMRRGNRPVAIRTYHQCSRTLEEELGVRPLRETERLFQEILNL